MSGRAAGSAATAAGVGLTGSVTVSMTTPVARSTCSRSGTLSSSWAVAAPAAAAAPSLALSHRLPSMAISSGMSSSTSSTGGSEVETGEISSISILRGAARSAVTCVVGGSSRPGISSIPMLPGAPAAGPADTDVDTSPVTSSMSTWRGASGAAAVDRVCSAINVAEDGSAGPASVSTSSISIFLRASATGGAAIAPRTLPAVRRAAACAAASAAASSSSSSTSYSSSSPKRSISAAFGPVISSSSSTRVPRAASCSLLTGW
mmetsp:Transcript_7370/g.18938  ORF Transcript_7370/g.18938 Transcript_7370/m.18938 type:complete len:262 (+) Transcript_7370:184-969(+)